MNKFLQTDNYTYTYEKSKFVLIRETLKFLIKLPIVLLLTFISVLALPVFCIIILFDNPCNSIEAPETFKEYKKEVWGLITLPINILL